LIDAAPDAEDFDAAVRAHDALLARRGFEVWVGAEPTFTDRFSDDVQWVSGALGDDKLARAQRLLVRLARQSPGAAVLRSVGRRYPGEDAPRWSYGLLATRDGTAMWPGPSDPLLAAAELAHPDAAHFLAALIARARDAGFEAQAVAAAGAERRLLLREPESQPPQDGDPRLARPSCHDAPMPESGVRDELAAQGLFLFLLRAETSTAGPVLRLELPSLGDTERLRRVLALVAAAAREAALPALILAGCPPPADAALAWTTVTPDPAVIEINSAPFPDCAGLLRFARELYGAAAPEGLAPQRLHFNGDAGDSGGAGQITLGGPAPAASPFFRHPHALPGWVRYANRHPALSYLFAHDYVGAFGQSVRSDERDREHFDELGLGLRLLAAQPQPDPEMLWRSLSPFLADIAGNAHRAELNIEKLWNPWLPERGKLGLLEFRALRMAPSAERLVAVAALLRAITARLAARPYDQPLIDWGPELHDRYALPSCLREDLLAVLEDLDHAGFGLGHPLRRVLLDDEFRVLGRVAFAGVELTVKRALEFWPLVGDTASQERGTSRLADASTARIELCLRPLPGRHDRDFDAWGLASEGGDLPLRRARDDAGPARLLGLRYRRYVPWSGLHPSLPAQGPIPLLLWHSAHREACRVTIHEWRPDRQPYDGLPKDAAEARKRRAERVVVETVAPPDPPPPPALAHALTPWCMDLRRL
jgi:uncharacterized protein (DUF2126 family)